MNSVIYARTSGNTSTVHSRPQRVRRTTITSPIVNAIKALPLVDLVRYPPSRTPWITSKIGADFSYEFCDTSLLEIFRSNPTWSLYGFNENICRGRRPSQDGEEVKDVIGFIDKGTIVITIDGSRISDPLYGPAMGAGIFFGPGSKHNVSLPLLERHPGSRTSQRAEILAAIAAVKKVMDLVEDEDIQLEKVYLITDSKVIVDAMNGLMEEWMENGWRNSRGEIITYLSDYADLSDTVDCLQEEFGIEAVFRHVYREWNIEADELAKEGSEAAGYHEYTSVRKRQKVQRARMAIPNRPQPVQTISESDYTRSLTDAMSQLALASSPFRQSSPLPRPCIY